jgi:peptidoglycan/xylan/chitin deacetylase (PgdA/CDA1 family)
MNKSVPVLMYHHVAPHPGGKTTVTPEAFEAHMRYLAKGGYRTLKMSELMAHVRGERPVRDRAVVVTFDDGWLDNFRYAYPVLLRYRINAVIFAVTAWADAATTDKATFFGDREPTHEESMSLIQTGEAGKVVLDWETIRQMASSGLVEFYSHTVNHLKCNDLDRHELERELFDAKAVLERELSQPCPYLCWPYGKCSKLAVTVAREAGYEALFITMRGVVEAGSNPHYIKRIRVNNGVTWFKLRMRIYVSSLLSRIYFGIRKH